MSRNLTKMLVFYGIILVILCAPLQVALAQRAAWRQATDEELASLLPARAQVQKEHIEIELRTASGLSTREGASLLVLCCLLPDIRGREVLALSDFAGANSHWWDRFQAWGVCTWMGQGGDGATH